MSADNNELGKKRSKQLEKLENARHEESSIWWEKLSVADFWLLLEHSPLVKQLIQNISNGSSNASPYNAAPAVSTYAAPDNSHELAALKKELAHEQDNHRLTRQKAADCAHDLQQCGQQVEALLREKTQLTQQVQAAQAEAQTARDALLRSQNSVPTEVRYLRTETALASTLELDNLPTDNTLALIRVVAVLSQRDNVERLWVALKDRCESDRRACNADETQLLRSAVQWLNFNWPTHPYALTEPREGQSYDYSKHLRSRHTVTGETVTRVCVPGIADSSGRDLKKPLIHTH